MAENQETLSVADDPDSKNMELNNDNEVQVIDVDLSQTFSTEHNNAGLLHHQPDDGEQLTLQSDGMQRHGDLVKLKPKHVLKENTFGACEVSPPSDFTSGDAADPMDTALSNVVGTDLDAAESLRGAQRSDPDIPENNARIITPIASAAEPSASQMFSYKQSVASESNKEVELDHEENPKDIGLKPEEDCKKAVILQERVAVLEDRICRTFNNNVRTDEDRQCLQGDSENSSAKNEEINMSEYHLTIGAEDHPIDLEGHNTIEVCQQDVSKNVIDYGNFTANMTLTPCFTETSASINQPDMQSDENGSCFTVSGTNESEKESNVCTSGKDSYREKYDEFSALYDELDHLKSKNIDLDEKCNLLSHLYESEVNSREELQRQLAQVRVDFQDLEERKEHDLSQLKSQFDEKTQKYEKLLSEKEEACKVAEKKLNEKMTEIQRAHQKDMELKHAEYEENLVSQSSKFVQEKAIWQSYTGMIHNEKNHTVDKHKEELKIMKQKHQNEIQEVEKRWENELKLQVNKFEQEKNILDGILRDKEATHALEVERFRIDNKLLWENKLEEQRENILRGQAVRVQTLTARIEDLENQLRQKASAVELHKEEIKGLQQTVLRMLKVEGNGDHDESYGLMIESFTTQQHELKREVQKEMEMRNEKEKEMQAWLHSETQQYEEKLEELRGVVKDKEQDLNNLKVQSYRDGEQLRNRIRQEHQAELKAMQNVVQALKGQLTAKENAHLEQMRLLQEEMLKEKADAVGAVEETKRQMNHACIERTRELLNDLTKQRKKLNETEIAHKSEMEECQSRFWSELERVKDEAGESNRKFTMKDAECCNLKDRLNVVECELEACRQNLHVESCKAEMVDEISLREQGMALRIEELENQLREKDEQHKATLRMTNGAIMLANSETERRLHEKDAEVEEFKRKIEEQETEYRHKQHAWQLERRDLLNKMREMEKTIEMKDLELKNLRESLHQTNNERTKAIDKTSTLSHALDERESLFIELEKRVRESAKHTEALDHQIHTLQEKCSQTENSNRILQEELKEREEQFNDLVKETDILRRLLEKEESHVGMLQNETTELGKKINEAEQQHSNVVIELNTMVETLQEDKRNAENELSLIRREADIVASSHKDELNKLQLSCGEKMSCLTKELEEKANLIAESGEEIGSLRDQLNTRGEEISQLHRNIEELQMEMDNRRREWDATREQMLQDHRKEMKCEEDRLQNQFEIRVEEMKKCHEAVVKIAKEAVERTDRERKEVLVNYLAAKDELSAVKCERDSRVQETLAYETKLSNMERLFNEQEQDLLLKCAAAETENDVLRDEYERTKGNLEAHVYKQEELRLGAEESINNLELEKERLVSDLNILRKEKSKTDERLGEKNSDLAKAMGELNQLRDELKDLTASTDTLKTELNLKDREAATVAEKMNGLDNCVREKNDELVRLQSKVGDMEKEHKEELKAVEERARLDFEKMNDRAQRDHATLVENLKGTICDERIQKQDIGKKYLSVQDLHNAAVIKCNTLQEEINRLRGEVAEKEAELSKSKMSEAEYLDESNRLRIDLAERETELLHFKKRCEDLESELSEKDNLLDAGKFLEDGVGADVGDETAANKKRKKSVVGKIKDSIKWRSSGMRKGSSDSSSTVTSMVEEDSSNRAEDSIYGETPDEISNEESGLNISDRKGKKKITSSFKLTKSKKSKNVSENNGDVVDAESKMT